MMVISRNCEFLDCLVSNQTHISIIIVSTDLYRPTGVVDCGRETQRQVGKKIYLKTQRGKG